MDIQANEQEKYEFIMSIASGQASFDQMHAWLLDHLGLIQPTTAMPPALIFLSLIGPTHSLNRWSASQSNLIINFAYLTIGIS